MKKNYAIYKLLTFAFIFSVGAVMAQSPNQDGQWSEPIQFGLVPVAVANLPDGRLLTWSSRFRDAGFDAADGNTYTEIYDPFQGPNGTALGTQITPNNHNMFCPGINNLANGDILVAGGGSAPKTTIYKVGTNRWEVSDDMNVPRGYQGNVTLPDGRAFTIGGQWNGGYSGKVGEIWTKGQGWVSLPGLPGTILYNDNDLQGNPIRPNDHAWVWVAPNGKIFHAGPSEDMHWFDVRGNGSSTFAGKRADDTFSITGTTIMYDIGKILKVGGALNYQQGFPSKDNSFVIDINNENNVTVSPTANNLQLSRSYHNSVVLPNGEVVVTGGISTSSVFTDTGARFEAEIWNPQTNSWRTVAGMQIPRTYHSVSILMNDGRVFVGGGGLVFGNPSLNHRDAEIYSPPYLFDGNGNLAQRPTISAPDAASYGQRITVNGSAGVQAFSFVRMSSATHSTNNEQRRIPVAFNTNGGQYTITVPNANVMPPGYYMLFAMNANGVPSIAETILVGNNGGDTTPPPPPPPTVSGTNLAPQANTITVSSEFSDAYSKQGAVDGVTGQLDGGEWASLGEQNPSIRLTWNRSLTTNQIVLYDRANTVDAINGAVLRFSDGSTVNVNGLDNAGAARLIEFQAKTITWVELDITNGAGQNVGISEFEVYGEYTGNGGDTTPPPPPPANGNNIALNKPAVQSSTDPAYGQPASFAVDGNTSGDYGAQTVTHTGFDNNASWRVDLQGTFDVSQIRVFNRTDCCSDRLRGAKVYVGNTASNNPANYTEVGTLTASTTVQNFSGISVRGRYVLIRHVRPEFLSLAEVQVFGESAGNGGDTTPPPPPPPTVSGTNLAPQANTITVSSEFSDAYSKQGAVDGVKQRSESGEWASRGEQSPTLRLTWNRAIKTKQVVLYDRPNTDDRINGATLRFSDGTSVNVGALDNNGAARSIDFNERTVTWVEINNINGQGPNVGLSEIEVYGEYAAGQTTDNTPTLPTQGQNLALNKPTQQSSTSAVYGGNSARAVDGNRAGNYTGNSVTHTEYDNNAWWRVDLGAAYNISRINVFNRTDCCSDRLNGTRVYVGNNASTNPGEYQQIGTLNENGAQEFANISATGRYVFIRKQGLGILHLAEVEVYGSAANNGGTNNNGGTGNNNGTIAVFPNPSNGNFTVPLGGLYDNTPVTFELYNSSNARVYRKGIGANHGPSERINISFLRAGVYTLIVESAFKRDVARILIR